jgi:hypothetical protein
MGVAVEERPCRQADGQHDRHGDRERDVAHAEHLQRGGQEHEGQHRAEQEVRGPGRDDRADDDAGDPADGDGRGQPEVQVPEQGVRDRGRRDQGHRLHDVRADQAPHRQPRVGQHQQHDHQRAGPDRGDADQQPAEDADPDGQRPFHGERLVRRGGRLAGPAVDQQADDDAGRRQHQRGAHRVFQALLHDMTGAQRVVDEHPGERGGH